MFCILANTILMGILLVVCISCINYPVYVAQWQFEGQLWEWRWYWAYAHYNAQMSSACSLPWPFFSYGWTHCHVYLLSVQASLLYLPSCCRGLIVIHIPYLFHLYYRTHLMVLLDSLSMPFSRFMVYHDTHFLLGVALSSFHFLVL